MPSARKPTSPARSWPTTLDGSLDDAYAASMVTVDDGQMVNGTVVRVDRDEVLVDIGYKSEGVIPARELSIRNDVEPGELVSVGDDVEALVLQKEDKEGRLLLSKKPSPVREGVGHHRSDQGTRRHGFRPRSSRWSRAA